MNALLQSIFYLLCVEVLCVSVLVCPLPLRGHLVRLISASNLMSTVGRPLMYFLSLVVLTWLFATREMMRLQSEYAEVKMHADLGIKLQHEAKMHRAQRDFYLSGFAALLLGVIVQLYRLLKEVNQLEATKAAMTKQAEGAAAAYKAANADKEDMARQLRAGGGGGEEQAAALRKKVSHRTHSAHMSDPIFPTNHQMYISRETHSDNSSHFHLFPPIRRTCAGSYLVLTRVLGGFGGVCARGGGEVGGGAQEAGGGSER